MTRERPRGLRNENPGNIRRTKPHTTWLGLSANQADISFYVFEDAVYGIRALAKILLTYQRKHGLKTIRQIINRWAPPVENDTDAYVRSVAKKTSYDADHNLDLGDYRIMSNLVEAIIHHENGIQPYEDQTIEDALVMAGIPRRIGESNV